MSRFLIEALVFLITADLDNMTETPLLHGKHGSLLSREALAEGRQIRVIGVAPQR